MKRQSQHALDPSSFPVILRVKSVLDNGRLVLVGSDGKVLHEHMENCALCHLQIDDDSSELDVACEVCGKVDDEDTLLLCDRCDKAFHTHCVGLDAVPDGTWLCGTCTKFRSSSKDFDDNLADERGQKIDGKRGAKTWINERGSAQLYTGVVRYLGRDCSFNA